MVVLNLPYPPTLNHMYGRHGSRTYLKPKGREYKKEVAEIVASQQVETLTGKIAVFIAVYPPDKRKRDIANLEKIVNDSLQDAGVFDDDFQIQIFMIARRDVRKGGSITVVINPIEKDSLK